MFPAWDKKKGRRKTSTYNRWWFSVKTGKLCRSNWYICSSLSGFATLTLCLVIQYLTETHVSFSPLGNTGFPHSTTVCMIGLEFYKGWHLRTLLQRALTTTSVSLRWKLSDFKSVSYFSSYSFRTGSETLWSLKAGLCPTHLNNGLGKCWKLFLVANWTPNTFCNFSNVTCWGNDLITIFWV